MAPQVPDPSGTSTTTTSSSSTTTTTSTQATSTLSSTSSTTSASSSSSSDSRSSSTSSSTTSTLTSTTPITGTTSTTRTTPGNVTTATSTMYITSSSRNVVSPTSTVGGGGSTPFLQNTGAVAGVFTVVGLIGLSLIFILARNFYRRRQQDAFDRDLQEATRQAAATSTGPFFDDDDDDPYKNTYGGAGANVYNAGERQFSDLSHGTHGTYSQPPLNVDSYGMREMTHTSGPGEMLYSSDPYAAGAAGAAGIGVARARSMRTDTSNTHQPDYAAALKDGNSPYPAFAGPNPRHMSGGVADPYASTGLAPHMAGAGGLSMANAPQSYAQQQYGGSYSQRSLDRRSVDSAGQHQATGPAFSTNRYSVVNEDMEDAYGGVVEGVDDHKAADLGDSQMPAPLPNPFEREISEEGHTKETDLDSVHSGHSQEEPRRVLKVANE